MLSSILFIAVATFAISSRLEILARAFVLPFAMRLVSTSKCRRGCVIVRFMTQPVAITIRMVRIKAANVAIKIGSFYPDHPDSYRNRLGHEPYDHAASTAFRRTHQAHRERQYERTRQDLQPGRNCEGCHRYE